MNKSSGLWGEETGRPSEEEEEEENDQTKKKKLVNKTGRKNYSPQTPTSKQWLSTTDDSYGQTFLYLSQ